MKRNPSESGTKNLADELAELRGLDATTLRQRWRVLYRTEAPVRIGQALLLQAVALPAAGKSSWRPQILHPPPARAGRRRQPPSANTNRGARN